MEKHQSMEYIETIVNANDRMYCPSTDEVIFAPGNKYINSNADAFIGRWSRGSMKTTSAKDRELKKAWKAYYKENIKKKKSEWEEYQAFFKEYDNPEWIVYECKHLLIACVTIKITDIYVVKADTIIEADPEYSNKVIQLNNDFIDEPTPPDVKDENSFLKIVEKATDKNQENK